MGGGLMQLVAYGAQDVYLSGNPQITFFKTVYRRHTNFSMESISQSFNGPVQFGKKSSCAIARNGDLLADMYLEITLPAIQQAQTTSGSTSSYVSWTDGIGNALIKSVSIDIGGQELDKHYGEWLDIWNELNLPDTKKKTFKKMVGYEYASDLMDPSLASATAESEYNLYVPLRFWFNNNPGLALPLIALQYHEIKINLDIDDVQHLIRNDGGHISAPQDSAGNALEIKECNLMVNYIYLDTDERRRFSQISHEYLIEQVQFLGTESVESTASTGTGKPNPSSSFHSVKLKFNHPVKVLHWIIQDDTYLANDSEESNVDATAYDSGNQKLRYSSLAKLNNRTDTFNTAKLQINGHDRMAEKPAEYYRLVQNNRYMPGQTSKQIYTYSFALNPGEHQPSGSCNFSRVDIAKLNLNFDTTSTSQNTKDDGTTYTGQLSNDVHVKVYAVNYNVLRIMSGMGGLAYSN